MTKDDIEIINLSGDVESLTEQLNAMRQRAEAAEAAEAKLEWIAKFPPNVRLHIDVVFPNEYRIGYQYERRQYIPGFPHYYSFDEAMRRCWDAFCESYPHFRQ